jgi:DegV family protein with EDD domain
MGVKIVTDSTADIPKDVARALGIAVVPVYVRFGNETYRDGVDMSSSQFFRKLEISPHHPTTSQPSPEDFAMLYKEVGQNADGIVSIHISSKLSGTVNSAKLGRERAGINCPVEIVDSTFNSMGLGLLAIAAARLARGNARVTDIVVETRHAISKIHMLGVFNTVRYLIAGGRISKAASKVADILNVKPLFTFREGEVALAGVSRTYSKAINRLCEFVKSKKSIAELSIVHSQVAIEAEALKQRFKDIVNPEKVIVSELGAALGSHGGPGVLLVAIRQE